jgi:hypothetical protein
MSKAIEIFCDVCGLKLFPQGAQGFGFIPTTNSVNGETVHKWEGRPMIHADHHICFKCLASAREFRTPLEESK